MKPKPSELYVLILAGGSGERFWPLSRQSRPKQLLQLFGEKSLLEETLDRLEGLVPPEHILILTNKAQEKSVRKLITRLPAENILAEPAKRDTAAAIALGIGWVASKDPVATMAVLSADHLIPDRENFQKVLKTAALAARQTGRLVCLGIKPTWACPGFGYLEQGQPAEIKGAEAPVYELARFREKPNPELAEIFLQQGNFHWNAGMFIWTIPSIISEMGRHTPELADFIAQVHQSKDLQKTIQEKFPSLPRISIDYAIMEKAAQVLMVEATFAWDDVGSWTCAAKYLKPQGNKNVSNCDVTAMDSGGNICFSSSGKMIFLIGVSDLIVVESEDAILVCNAHEAEDIKKLVARLPDKFK